MKPQPSVERILVAVDTSKQRLRVCDTAARFAAAFESKLIGVLVEDVRLFRSAELPGTQELGMISAQVRPWDLRRVESQLRARARRARIAFEDIAARRSVACAFEIRKMAAAPGPLGAAGDAAARPILVLLDSDDDWPSSALEVALSIAESEGRAVFVLLSGGDPSPVEAAVRARAAQSNIPLHWQRAPAALPGCHLVVVPATSSHLSSAEALDKLLQRSGAPIVVVGKQGNAG
jgi:nucleotide-binding universal stress UspA family protein